MKRQKKAGKVLTGNAAKLKRRAQLVARGVEDANFLDDLTAAVGLPGQLFYVNGNSSNLSTLPARFVVKLETGERAARAALLAYHASACNGKPKTKVGRDHALRNGWAAPQQAFALDGCHPGSDNRKHMCNLLVWVHEAQEPVGLLAMSLDAAARSCSVQAIHVAPRLRGPLQLPSHLWQEAKDCVRAIAHEKLKKLAHNKCSVWTVRFTLEVACCQSQQGAHFWIERMGWDGTTHAKQAAKEWGKGVKWKPGTYQMWYKLPVQRA